MKILMNGMNLKITDSMKSVVSEKLNSLSKRKKDEHYNSVLASYYGYFLNADCKAFLKRHSWYENKKYKK